MGATDREIRTAAETLLASTSSHSIYPQVTSNISSINSPDYVVSDDIFTGLRQNGQMSVVRRFFCFFVTFDLVFTFFMWLICIMLAGGDIFSALTAQVIHYDIHISVFDIAMAAICRFTVLLLFYGLLLINHWCIIALSTAGTSAFLIAKVFVYNWEGSHQPVFEVLLVLSSFIVAWGEAWFLDFRVIPQESQAFHFIQGSTLSNERTPLIRNYLQRLPRYDDNTESVGNFYSPLDSPQGSDDEEDNASRRKFAAKNDRTKPFDICRPANEEEMKTKAKEILQKSWSILNSSDWKLERETPEGDVVHSKTLHKGCKVFKVIGTVEFPPKFLLTELFDRIEDFPNWNPTLKESQRVQIIDDRTDIYYQVANEGAGGIVSSRDFVNLRHWGELDGCYVSAAVSIQHPDIPPLNKYIRGENGPNCWVMRPIPGEEKRCEFQWLLNTNLRGWIPQYVLDPALTTVMVEYMGYLRKYSTKLREEGAF